MKTKFKHNPHLPQLNLTEKNIFILCYFILDDKQRNQLAKYKPQTHDKFYAIANSIIAFYYHDMFSNRTRKILANLRSYDVISYIDVIDGKDNDGYRNRTIYFQVKPEYYHHFIDFNHQDKGSFLFSQSFQEVLENKLRHNNQALLNCLYHAARKLYTVQSDRNYHIRKDGTFSYLPRGKKSFLNENGRWSLEGRTTSKMGRGLRKLFETANIKNAMDDTELEHLVKDIQSEYMFNGKISEVRGQDIVKWYNGSYYAPNQAALSSSCMRHDNCSSYIEFYANNPDNCSMIIAVNDENLLLGRAIVWHNATIDYDGESHNNVAFCDRIYGKPLTVTAMQKYAHSHGYITKAEQNYHNETGIALPNGRTASADITVKVNRHDYYPYMDTLKSIEELSNDKGILYNNNDYRDLTGTDGNSDGEYVTLDNGDRIHEDDARWSNYSDMYIHEEDALFSECMSDYIHVDSYIAIHNDDLCHVDESCSVILPDGSDAYDYEPNTRWGYSNGQHCQISEDFCITYDNLLEIDVYEQEVNTIVVTMNDNNGVEHTLTLNTVLSELEVSSYSLDKLISASYEHTQSSANTDND